MSKANDAKRSIDKLDRELDKRLEEFSITALRSRAKARVMGEKVKDTTEKAITIGDATRKRVDDAGDKITHQLMDVTPGENIQRFIVEKPLMVVITVFIICGLVTAVGIPLMLSNVDGDMEVYLPENDPATLVVDEVRNEGGSWSVDILIIYVETPNAKDTTDITNITDVAVLSEMDSIERALNKERGDEGANDSVRFILSMSVIVQEVNATPENFQEALETMLGPVLSEVVEGLDELEGEYAIPDQNRVNQIVEYIPSEFLDMLVKDSNGDGIYDTAGIFVGLDKEADQAEFFQRSQEAIDVPLERTEMWLTGPVAMTRSLTERTYEETVKIVPIAVVLVFASLAFFHRNPKIILISGIPIALSVGSTFGILGIIGVTITPQALLIAPVLIALGVAYGLYIANRYAEDKDITDRKERVIHSIKAIHKPILLSALTTTIGFASLMIADMTPLKVIGLGLAIGIIFSYVITMLLVPSLLNFLKYEKTTRIAAWKKVGEFPVAHRKKIVIVGVLAMMVSLLLIPTMEANLDLFEMAPADDPTIDKMAEFGEKFGGGQIGMAVVYGNPRNVDVSHDGSMEDSYVLSDINTTQSQTRLVENTKTISVVDVMKTIRVPQDIVVNYSGIEYVIIEENTSFWDAAIEEPHWIVILLDAQDEIIQLFYESISPEMRYLMVNKEYSKTLLFVDMPTMDVADTKEAVIGMNDALQDHGTSVKEVSLLTGAAAIAVAVNDLVLENAFETLVIALVLVFFVLLLAFRSVKYAIITLIPVALVTSYQPLTFRLLGMDLNLLTGMVGSMIVGIGIDFGIHMTERIRERGETIRNVKYAVETSGISFFETTITVLLGLFSALIAGIASVNQFVFMIGVLFVLSMLGAIFILPAMFSIKILGE